MFCLSLTYKKTPHAEQLYPFRIPAPFFGTAFSQVTVQEKHYTVTYNHGSIALSFDQNVSLKAVSADKLAEKNVLVDSTHTYTYTITDARSSEVIKVSYAVNDGWS